MELLLTKNISNKDSHTLDAYVKTGGYRALEKSLKMEKDAIIEEVKISGLRGRGGAGFPCGLKWSFVPKDFDGPKFLCCNADESEPGTFKDKVIIEKDPHMLLEGIAICCYAIGAGTCYIYIRGEYYSQAAILEKAIEEAEKAGYLGKNILGSGFNLQVVVHRGAGAYVCGEETALMESVEGKRGHPRLKPPFPAQSGVHAYPTNINNVETLAAVPHIIDRGGKWFASIGPNEKNSGTKLYAVSGHVKKPGVYEYPMGLNLKELIYDVCGGIRDDRKLKAVIPGGSSVPVLTADEIDVSMDFDSMVKAGSMLGSAGVIVMDETVCMVRAMLNLMEFYHHESCGQCTPCREGTGWLEKILKRIETGYGRKEDIDLMLDVSDKMQMRTVCPLADAACMPLVGFIKKFRSEFEEHIEKKGCPFGR